MLRSRNIRIYLLRFFQKHLMFKFYEITRFFNRQRTESKISSIPDCFIIKKPIAERSFLRKNERLCFSGYASKLTLDPEEKERAYPRTLFLSIFVLNNPEKYWKKSHDVGYCCNSGWDLTEFESVKNTRCVHYLDAKFLIHLTTNIF